MAENCSSAELKANDIANAAKRIMDVIDDEKQKLKNKAVKSVREGWLSRHFVKNKTDEQIIEGLDFRQGAEIDLHCFIQRDTAEQLYCLAKAAMSGNANATVRVSAEDFACIQAVF